MSTQKPICEECGTTENTELVEVPYGYSHYDGYVFTYDKVMCEKCLEKM